MSRPEDDPAFLQRIVSDPEFRARYRRKAAGADDETPLETLELRESRSSLAGALTAAAVEGLAFYEYLGGGLVGDAQAAEHVAPPAPADLPDADEPDEPDEPDPPGDDDGDEPDDDGDEPDEEEEDEDDDEDEPDEEEPDEVGPDFDDLHDDEVTGEDDADDGSDADEDPDSHDDSDGSGDADDTDDSGGRDDSGDDAGDAIGPLDDVGADYPGDAAPRSRIAAWMAAEAQRRGLPPELPVMAALVESDMRNLPGGDADSVGFFQMRTSIWNTGEYAGYAGRPELQLEWFMDHALAVKQQRAAGGLPMDPAHYGEWIADVERPAAQYRGRYQLRLEEARELLRAHEPRPPAAGELADGAEAAKPGPRALQAVAQARGMLGTPYRWGGSSPRTGFDCSGLVQWAYAKAGIAIPRVTHEQITAPGARKVARDDLLPGDLVFFRDASGYVHHVGMSIGGDRFINAPSTGSVVRIDSLDDPYWAKEYAGARRFDSARASGAQVLDAVRPEQVRR